MGVVAGILMGDVGAVVGPFVGDANGGTLHNGSGLHTRLSLGFLPGSHLSKPTSLYGL